MSIDTSELNTIPNDYRVYQYEGSEISDSVFICPTTENLYLTAKSYFSNDAKVAAIEVPQNASVIKITDTDFSHDGVEVANQGSFNTTSVSTRGYIEDINSYEFVQFTYINSPEPLFVFPTVTEHNFYVQTDSSVEPTTVDGARIDMHSYARSSVDSDGSYELTELPTITEDLGFSLLQFTESNDSSFDFSNVDSRFARAVWDYSFLVDDEAESRFDWTIRGGISGQIPDLSFGTVFPEPTDEVILEELTLFLFGYAGNATDANSYAKLLDTITEGGHLTKPEFSNYVYVFLNAELD